MKYPIAIETGSETTAWGVAVPDLPGCFSAGDSPDEAYAMAREAIELWINTTLDAGQPIPKAKTLVGAQNGWTMTMQRTTQSCPQLTSGFLRLEMRGSWCMPAP